MYIYKIFAKEISNELSRRIKKKTIEEKQVLFSFPPF